MDKNTEQTLDRLTREAKSWKSIEFKTSQEFVNSSGSDDKNVYQKALFKEHYVETALGQRYDQIIDLPTGGREKLAEYYCDGEKCADVAFEGGFGTKQSQVSIKRSFKSEAQVGVNFRAIPLRYLYYAGNPPLAETLRDAESLGRATVLGRACDAFLLRRFSHGVTICDLVYTLDRETGVPLKLVGYNDDTGYAAARPSWRWEVLKADSIQGHLFPMDSEEVIYFPPPNGKDPKARDRSAEVVFRTTHHVESVRFDGDYPKTTFWPKIAPEANVFDSINHRLTPSRVKATPATTAKVADPIRAEAPQDWSSTASVGGLVLGTSLLLVGLVTWRRRSAGQTLGRT